MTVIDVFSGFLGAGKTTLIKKLISEAYAGEKLVLIENEFGEIGKCTVYHNGNTVYKYDSDGRGNSVKKCRFLTKNESSDTTKQQTA